MDIEEKKKYVQMENVLNKINQKHISLPDDEKKRNTKILETITENITSKLKEKDDLFRHLYERKFYGGSYYDGIKVGKPEEYDLDYVLNLPLLAEAVVETSDRPGFVCVRIKEYVKLLKSPEGKKFDKLDSLMDGQYLSTPKVLAWMERIMTLALNDIEKDTNGNYFDVDIGQDEPMRIYASIAKAHPAFTLKLKNKDSSVTFDVDLVPCFQFTNEKWPKGDYRPNPTPTRNKFLVVPKKPYIISQSDDVSKYLRLSFQEQERDLMTGNEFNKMKPTIKLLKLLRDKHDHKIASYFIKTVFLWEIDERIDTVFWSQPLSYVFMQMLQKYADMLEKKCIPYYWNKRFNLIGHLKDSTVTGIANCLKKIIKDVKNNLDDPFRVAKYLVSSNQAEILRSEVPLSKKYLRHTFSLDTSATSGEDSADGFACSSNGNERSENSSTSSITSKPVARTDTSDLRKSLASSSDRLVDAIEQLQEQNKELRESYDAVLKICNMLSARVTNLESKCEKLSLENRLLARPRESLNSTASEFDRLSLLASLLQRNVMDGDSLNK